MLSEIAYVATLCKDHYDHCKLLLEHGKHVFCEKPLCVNVEQVKELINLAKEKDVFLAEVI
jgi:predicted dehydrogenase